jgi:dienelactone hydrolase
MHPRLARNFISVTVATGLSLSCGRAPDRHAANAPPPPQVVRIWPAGAPGTESWRGPEQTVDADLPNLGKVHIITNVTVPTLTVYRPEQSQATGIGMLVVPGGAFRALPWDLDGTETAQWLTRHGMTAFVLKYRLRPPTDPSANGPESFDHFARRTEGARTIAVADAEQAVRFIRAHSGAFGLAPHRLGMIGFSAGAMTVMVAASAEEADVRPDFAVSMYGALLTSEAPAKDAPPLFIVAAQDDDQVPAERSADIFRRWTAAGLPAELHLYEKGGHGFGFRPHHLPADRWPDAFLAWLQGRGYLARPKELRTGG